MELRGKGEALEIWEVHCLNQAADARRAAPGVTGVTGVTGQDTCLGHAGQL